MSSSGTNPVFPDLIYFCSSSCNAVFFTAFCLEAPSPVFLPFNWIFFSSLPLHACASPTQSVFLSFPPCLLSLSLSSSPPNRPHASVRYSTVEDPSPVRGNKAPLLGPPSGQGAVPLSVICWYRVQSLSFSESCRSVEVKERPCVCRHQNMYTWALKHSRFIQFKSDLSLKHHVAEQEIIYTV